MLPAIADEEGSSAASGHEVPRQRRTGGGVSYIIGLVIVVAFMAATYYVAVSKGRSPWLWVILAFFFSFIPLIIVAIMPRKQA
jgi:membrane protein YdbS with pleckstrin-like domain